LPIEQHPRGGRFRAGHWTEGPWDARLQHGGPPNALAVAEADRVLRAETGRDDLLALRLAADFVGPVPVDDVEVTVEVVRAARSAALVAVRVAAGGRDCVLARIWFVRNADTADLAGPQELGPPVPATPSQLDHAFGYGASLDWRFVRGRMGVPGPAAAWVRPTMPICDGYPASGLARVALIADSASGISAQLDWATWSFVNVDLDIHLARPLRGEWLFVDAVTQLGEAGSALARSTLSDEHGVLGSSLQTLVVAPMSTR
jgi:acyl-coenzyme A thioesterase PaaI-like protein